MVVRKLQDVGYRLNFVLGHRKFLTNLYVYFLIIRTKGVETGNIRFEFRELLKFNPNLTQI